MADHQFNDRPEASRAKEAAGHDPLAQRLKGEQGFA